MSNKRRRMILPESNSKNGKDKFNNSWINEQIFVKENEKILLPFKSFVSDLYIEAKRI